MGGRLCRLSSKRAEKTRAIIPIALINFLIQVFHNQPRSITLPLKLPTLGRNNNFTIKLLHPHQAIFGEYLIQHVSGYLMPLKSQKNIWFVAPSWFVFSHLPFFSLLVTIEV
jgi:hypothetical protein